MTCARMRPFDGVERRWSSFMRGLPASSGGRRGGRRVRAFERVILSKAFLFEEGLGIRRPRMRSRSPVRWWGSRDAGGGPH